MKGLAQEAVRLGTEEFAAGEAEAAKLAEKVAEEKAATVKGAAERDTVSVQKAAVEKDTEEAKLKAKADAEAEEEICANLSDPSNAVFINGSNTRTTGTL